jgi:predicted GIY-YIG superfamily endonuclease
LYLIHFHAPYRHARHYLGWARNLDARLAHHRRGTGARLLAVVTAAGIQWEVVATWQGTRDQERRMKNNGGLARCCPVCGGNRFKQGRR